MEIVQMKLHHPWMKWTLNYDLQGKIMRIAYPTTNMSKFIIIYLSNVKKLSYETKTSINFINEKRLTIHIVVVDNMFKIKIVYIYIQFWQRKYIRVI
jgi:hypothetical protein